MIQLLINHLFVSTHSRPKAAAGNKYGIDPDMLVSTHSRPKAADIVIDVAGANRHVSTHSRPKAAGSKRQASRLRPLCFNTQPPEGGWDVFAAVMDVSGLFQHAAARRRLG